VIAPSKISLFPLPKRSEIDAAAYSYLDSFNGPLDPLESPNSTGRKLYETLIRPAETLIPKNSRVIILPDGGLNALNFEALVVSAPKPHYWIDDATISIANSLSLLSRAHTQPPPKSPDLLLFGDPISPAKEFPTLTDARDEIAAVTQPFPESHRTLLLRADAKASAYRRSNPGKFSYLHFATHGTASRVRPLE
jgi:CHAT domain-containing protein